ATSQESSSRKSQSYRIISENRCVSPSKPYLIQPVPISTIFVHNPPHPYVARPSQITHGLTYMMPSFLYFVFFTSFGLQTTYHGIKIMTNAWEKLVNPTYRPWLEQVLHVSCMKMVTLQYHKALIRNLQSISTADLNLSVKLAGLAQALAAVLADGEEVLSLLEVPINASFTTCIWSSDFLLHIFTLKF